MYVDTVENWEQTVDSCSNLLERKFVWGEMEIRYYVAVVSQFDFIAFHRPAHLPKLEGKLTRFYNKNQFEIPAGMDSQCHDEYDE